MWPLQEVASRRKSCRSISHWLHDYTNATKPPRGDFRRTLEPTKGGCNQAWPGTSSLTPIMTACDGYLPCSGGSLQGSFLWNSQLQMDWVRNLGGEKWGQRSYQMHHRLQGGFLVGVPTCRWQFFFLPFLILYSWTFFWMYSANCTVSPASPTHRRRIFSLNLNILS